MEFGHIFRAYDIRGIYGIDLTERIANHIGKSLAAYIDGEGKDILVGRDVRLSSRSLKESFIAGLIHGGSNVEDIGIATTPVLYFASVHYKKDGGVMTTASHNPPEWNGFKIWNKNHFICKGMGMEDIRTRTIRGEFEEKAHGELTSNSHAISDYEEFVLKRIDLKKKERIAVDPGNGSCCLLIPRLYQESGIEVTAINAEIDGSFKARGPEPNEETLNELKHLVIKEKCDFGVGFDGDGDRGVIIDDKGRIVSGDQILIVLIQHYLKNNKGSSVVFEVSCSMNVKEAIEANGGIPIVSRVGHTYIVDEMIKRKAVLGGETSSHFYFSDLYGFDDAMYASLKIAEALSEKDVHLSEILDSIPKYPKMPNINYDCPDKNKARVVNDLKNDFAKMGYQTITMDGVKVLKPEGWFLIRSSNTEPQVRLTVEAKTREKLRELTSIADKMIRKKIRSVGA